MNPTDWYNDLPKSFNKKSGHEYFRRGDYLKGFKLYARSGSEGRFGRLPSLETLLDKGASISLAGGFGDVIQFLRFVKVLSLYGVKTEIVMTDRYAPLEELLLMQSYASITWLSDSEKTVINIARIPYLLRCNLFTLPAEKYLEVNQHSTRLDLSKLRKLKGVKIGVQLNCGKSIDSGKNRGRDIPIDLFKSLKSDDVHLVNLDRENINKPDLILDFGEKRSFIESIDLINDCDLVISADTAMCHIAGAMHVPVWTVLPHPCSSWRWYQHETRTLWYPTMKLFRQSKDGSWEQVFECIKRCLNKLKDSKREV